MKEKIEEKELRLAMKHLSMARDAFGTFYSDFDRDFYMDKFSNAQNILMDLYELIVNVSGENTDEEN